jgi:hypothetical protein
MPDHHLSHAALRTVGILLIAGFIIFSSSHSAFLARAVAVDDRPSTPDMEVDDERSTDQLAALGESRGSDTYGRAPKYDVSSSTPQFVLFSFDGSRTLPRIRNQLDFMSLMNTYGKPLKFTYFVNAAHFLADDSATLYAAPGHAPGISLVGFGGTAADVAERNALFDRALREGNEVASHAVGHFNGEAWTSAEWTAELDAFKGIMGARNDTITGFRAPSLGVNDAMYQVIADKKFRYDSSGVGNPREWPHKNGFGTWMIPLGTIHLGSDPRPVLSMDYSIWMRQSGAKEVATRGTPLWKNYYDDVVKAYEDYFNENYTGSRAPVMICNHISPWNDGVYWQAMEAFAQEVCGKPNVRCSTYSELVKYLDTNGVPKIL